MFRKRQSGPLIWALAACCALACSLLALASPALASYEGVPTPTIEGPIAETPTSHIFMRTNVPLSNYGYTEEEFFISGTGSTYNTGGAVGETGTKVTTGGPNENGTYPFKTRIVVRRPINPANFNGKVMAEWQNVTAGFDLEPLWDGDPYAMMKAGYVYVAVDAQPVGVTGLKKYNSERYGSLEVGPSNGVLAFDVYAAALKAIRGDGVGPQPLGNLTPAVTNVTASGASQSCSELATYYNKVAPLQEVANDFLLTDCTSALRSDRPAKVLRVISEFEGKLEQPAAEFSNPAERYWEAAAGSHVPSMVQANWGPLINRDEGPAEAECSATPVLSTVSWPYSVDAGLGELTSWQEGGSPPPAVPEDEYVNSKTLKRNSLGIALGGLRLPEVEVPVVLDLAENSAHAAPNPYPFSAFCTLYGQHQNFSEETLDSLYGNYQEYVEKAELSAQKMVTEGLLLPEGARRIVDQAEEEPRLRPTTPAISTSSPNTGSYQLKWRGPVPSYPESLVPKFIETHPTFEVQHRNAGGEWTTVASGMSEPTYTFAPEEEGTWSYRVRSSTVEAPHLLEPEEVIVSPWSQPSAEVKVDRSAPNAPIATPSRAPDYAGGGGWYKDSVTVSFTENGDPLLPDGSQGSGVNPASIPASQTFDTSGSHTACGTVTDSVGNESTPGCVTVQVDATAPTLEVSCPTSVGIGAKAEATVTAADEQSGLASNPSGSVPINTSKAGPQTVTRTAIDNVGHETTKSCTTIVGYFVTITGPVQKLVVRSGEAVGLAATASVAGKVTVKPGGALDVEGAKLSGSVTASGAALLRICGATVDGKLKVSGGDGSVVLGEGNAECAANTIHGATTVAGNTAGVTIDANAFGSSLKVTGNAGGTYVTHNTIAGGLSVLVNTGTVVDTPNSVTGKSKLQ
jgi:Alpha/beta hydrolase domain